MLRKIFYVLSKLDIQSMGDEELIQARKQHLRTLTIIIVSAFILIEAALWYGYNDLWQLLFIITLIIAIPRMITSSRLSAEYFKRKS